MYFHHRRQENNGERCIIIKKRKIVSKDLLLLSDELEEFIYLEASARFKARAIDNWTPCGTCNSNNESQRFEGCATRMRTFVLQYNRIL